MFHSLISLESILYCNDMQRKYTEKIDLSDTLILEYSL